MNVKERFIDLIRNRDASLPTLPVVIGNLLEKANSESATPEELARFLSNDQSLASRVLKIANSPYYGLLRKIDSITRAVTVIGFREVVSIALGSGVIRLLTPPDKEGLVDLGELWRHSIAVGFASKEAGKIAGKPLEESVMLAGLLHDVGKVLFLTHFMADYAEVLVKHQIEGMPIHLVEDELMGIDHAEIAYLLMKQWNFPDSICMPVRHHHAIDQCPAGHRTVALLVNAADYACHAAGMGVSAHTAPGRSDANLRAIGLTEQGLEKLIDTSRSSLAEVEAFLEAVS